MSTTFNIGFVIFPDLTQLDFTGPLQVLNRLPGAKVHIIAKSREPVPSDCGLSLLPTMTFADCPQLDLICVPGGAGVVDVMADRETIDFVRKQAAGARFVTSVCTGAFVLGAAGLLKGRRATTHWGYTELLPLLGATYEKARIVTDGNVITASAPRAARRLRSTSEPPWASAICRASTRPMPEPSGLVVKNGTNRLPVFDRPGPSSSTQSSMDGGDDPGTRCQPIRTAPPVSRTASMALRSRLISSCSS